MTPICVPGDWDDEALITFEQFCSLLHTPQRTVRDWRRRNVGPRWTKLPGCGRLYIRVREVRRFLDNGKPPGRPGADGNGDPDGSGDQ